MEETNYSLTGVLSEKLDNKTKISLGMLIAGIGLFSWALYKEGNGISYEKILGFLFIMTGSGLFFNKNWRVSLGSILFVLGIVLLYLGYVYKGKGDKDLLYTMTLSGFCIMALASFLFTYDPERKYTAQTHYFKATNWTQKMGLFLSLLGFGAMITIWFAKIELNPSWLYLILILGSMALGILLYTYGTYKGHTAGIKNNHVMFNAMTNRGVLGFAAGILLTIFYIQLYWYSDSLTELIALFDSYSEIKRGKPADQWFVYGTLYSFVILFLGIKFIIKYRHNRYQLIRTVVVIFSQLVLADMLPAIMEAFNYNAVGGYYDANIVQSWPLNYDAFTPGNLQAYSYEAHQPIGMAYFFWSLMLFLVVTPIVTYFVGKRWYCSWFCGCGGLAETAGDSYRHLSNKGVKAWKIERWVIHSVLVFVLLMTFASLYPYLTNSEFVLGFATLDKNLFYFIASALTILAGVGLYFWYKKHQHKVLLAGVIVLLFVLILLNMAYFMGDKDIFMISSGSIKKSYAFFVGAAFSGVIGVGFYPILGNRVWCRFGCPMAAYMGLFQRFKSRFRISTNGSQCISCGNCSTYCEQGIDVRAYAQKGENIVRASCVGCGICSAVCPRGVLKLENGPEEGRFEPNPLEVTKDGVKLHL
ncbi:4Fe-4S binding protein [Crocinitomicaceae bacterium]|nr:4Fe-4S binding protein [Crocinitomicaceae bacterium]